MKGRTAFRVLSFCAAATFLTIVAFLAISTGSAAASPQFSGALGDALQPGSGLDIHAWGMETLPEWTEGETSQVALWREFGTQGQQTEPFSGPDPVHRLPAGVRAAGTLNPGDTLTGEITTRGEFLPYKLVVEPGHRYRVDMMGADTGDGTLSDPWISGIKGAFDTDNGVQMQPVWYDEQGRSSTDITWPNGGHFVLDQYGRFFTVSTGSNGETVHLPPMGANDDAGEGLNARLFLVNFPAREYVIVVSGSPNPSPVGTFMISLTDVSSDDYSGDATRPGQVHVGCCESGVLETPGDVDWFSMSLSAGTDYEIQVRGDNKDDLPVGQPALAAVFDGSGEVLWDSEAQGQRTVLEFSPQTDGTYYAAVTSVAPYYPNISTLPVGAYEVSLSEKS